MTTTETERTRAPFLAVLLYYSAYIAIFGMIGLGLFIGWPSITAAISARLSGQQLTIPVAPTTIPVAPTASPIQQPASGTYQQPVSAPYVPSIEDYNATATAQYQQVISVPAPVPNTGQGEPVVIEQRPAAERMPAGDNVPTAEPIPPAESGGIFGSKPMLINPQATHECKHGQVWTENKGCKNP